MSIRGSETFDAEMLGIKQIIFLAPLIISVDIETQVQPPGTQVLESIQSFGQETVAEAIQRTNVHDNETSDNGLDCLCEVFVCPSIPTTRLFTAHYIQ